MEKVALVLEGKETTTPERAANATKSDKRIWRNILGIMKKSYWSLGGGVEQNGRFRGLDICTN